MENKRPISELIEEQEGKQIIILVCDGMEDRHNEMIDKVANSSKVIKDSIGIIGCGAMSEVLVQEVMRLQTNKQIVLAVTNINDFPLVSSKPQAKSFDEIMRDQMNENLERLLQTPLSLNYPEFDEVAMTQSKKEYGVSKNKPLPIKNISPKGFVGRKVTLRGKHR